ncbi:unannotated protein [freshwater metagenome]|uniref:Unannotated protein n=1 Tax=freshwater metagenome TaxID=449393 RepID=A0A6J5YYR7_9ZZZZ
MTEVKVKTKTPKVLAILAATMTKNTPNGPPSQTRGFSHGIGGTTISAEPRAVFNARTAPNAAKPTMKFTTVAAIA